MRVVAGLLLMVVILLASASVIVNSQSEDAMFSDLDALPTYPVGLVLGCPPVSSEGIPNFYFQSRIEAAARLFRAGKVQYLLLSGSHDGGFYDESREMKKALLAFGVPEERMWLDREGNRTLLSIQRARDVYGVRKLIVVTQAFHAQRALFLARHAGIEAVSYHARDLGFFRGLRTRLREYLARARAVADVYVFDS